MGVLRAYSIPETTENKDLEGTVLGIFEKIGRDG